jgi:glucokinase
MSTIIAVDIGGTQIRAAAYAQNSTQPITIRKTSTQGEGALFDRLAALIRSVMPANDSVAAIGVASPGPLNPHTGMIIATPNIKEWVNFPLVQKLQDEFRIPVFLDNDANLACLGEWKFGAGRGHENILYLTISTGIGGGVIMHNKLLQGHQGLGAELGHVIVLPDGPICGCGHSGHVEGIASGTAIVRFMQERIKAGDRTSLQPSANLSARDVAEAARSGDPIALAAYRRAGKYLGIAVANFLHIFNPSVVIFGGGVSQSGDILFKPFETSLRDNVFDPAYLEDLIITTAALGDDAGLLGALAFASLSTQ